MKTSRNDIEIDRKQVMIKNSSTMGYSRWFLRKGDMFIYKEYYQDGSFHYRQAISHGRVRPLKRIDDTDKLQWFVLAQTISENLQYSYERWIEPENITETIPKKNMSKYSKLLFKHITFVG